MTFSKIFYIIFLQARGSEPPAQILWYLGESPLDNFEVEVEKSWNIIYIYLCLVFQYLVINFSIILLEAQPRAFWFFNQVSTALQFLEFNWAILVVNLHKLHCKTDISLSSRLRRIGVCQVSEFFSNIFSPIKYFYCAGENDNKRRLSCRAYNKNIPGSTIDDHWDILVMCKSSNNTSIDIWFYR